MILVNKCFKNWSFQKNVINKKHALNWYSSMKTKLGKKQLIFRCRKLTLKVRNWHFSTAWFRADVDLTKEKLWKSGFVHSIKLPFDAEVDEKFWNVI